MPLEGEVNDVLPESSPTQVGNSRIEYLATRLGLDQKADPDAVAVAALKAMEAAGGMVEELQRELKGSVDANRRVLEDAQVVHAAIALLGQSAGIPEKAGSMAIITAAKRQLDAAVTSTADAGRLRVIEAKATANPGLRAAIRLLAHIHPQTDQKNANVGTASYTVTIPEADGVNAYAMYLALSELEAVCVEPATPAADKNDRS